MAYQNRTFKSQTICNKEIYGLSHPLFLGGYTAQDVLERAERLGVQMRCGVHSGKVQPTAFGRMCMTDLHPLEA